MSSLESKTFILPMHLYTHENYKIDELLVALFRESITGDIAYYNSAVECILSDLFEVNTENNITTMLRKDCDVIREQLLPQIKNKLSEYDKRESYRLLQNEKCCVEAEIVSRHEVVFSITNYPS